MLERIAYVLFPTLLLENTPWYSTWIEQERLDPGDLQLWHGDPPRRMVDREPTRSPMHCKGGTVMHLFVKVSSDWTRLAVIFR